MNSVTFGDEHVGYYETVAGGAGAVSFTSYILLSFISSLFASFSK